jgi:phosphonate transport system substrate-binding protein
LAITAVALVALTSCQETAQPSKIRLAAATREGAGQPTAPIKAPLRIAVAPVISPRENFRLYVSLMDYLARRLERPVEFLQRRTYSEINDLVRNGHADVAFVCDYAYVQGALDFGMQILVVPEVLGSVTYQSLLIVPAASEARSLDDLRGKTFAFSDPLSSSGWLYPAYLLKLKGEGPETFFRRTVFTYSHDSTVRAVADRLVDGGAVDSLVYDVMVVRAPDLARRLRIVGRSPRWGNPPVVVHPRIDAFLRDRLRDIFLSMSEDPTARPFLTDLMIDRFVPLDDAYYRDVRGMAARITRRP